MVPEGFRKELSVDTDNPTRLCVNYAIDPSSSCPFPFKGQIKGLMTKIPGFFFSGYRQATYMGAQVLTSNKGFMDLLSHLMRDSEAMKENFGEELQGYNFTNGIPKDFMFVRLKAGLP